MSRFTLLWAGVFLLACGNGVDDQALLSAPHGEVETTLSLAVDGELLVDTAPWSAERTVLLQLMFAYGQLRSDGATLQLDDVELSNIRLSRTATGETRLQYHAALPMRWPAGRGVPERYILLLPRRVDPIGLAAFVAAHGQSCTTAGSNADLDTFWKTYHPRAAGCGLTAAEVASVTARVGPASARSGTYPELARVWADDTLDVLAVFTDAPVDAEAALLQAIGDELTGCVIAPTGAAGVHEVELLVTLEDGRRVRVSTLRPGGGVLASALFAARYLERSADADVVWLSDAGAEAAAAVAELTTVPRSRYQIVGHTTTRLSTLVAGDVLLARARANLDDPRGTRYLDELFVLTGGTPLPQLVTALVGTTTTYDAALGDVVVLGDEDNQYFPGRDDQPPVGFVVRGEVGVGDNQHHSSGLVPPGTYVVTLSHDPLAPRGDADLYVRVGGAATSALFDCHPYLAGSEEECLVDLVDGSTIHAMVSGFSQATAPYTLTIRPLVTGGLTSWRGLSSRAAVAATELRVVTTPLLGQGTYTIALTGDGDADLYVRVHAAPTTKQFDCRPFKDGSNETCTVTLEAPAVIHIGVAGWASESRYVVSAH